MKHRTPLKVRHIDFRFGNHIPYHWNPQNVRWGNFVNMVSLAAPGFELYFIRAIREALPRISDPALAEEAEKFCKQEAQHSKHHVAHLRTLTREHPGLDEVAAAVKASYQAIFERESLEFHLAYAAIVELWFGPIAKYVIDNKECLFRGADATVTSFMLWHLIEEFEHRNSAIDVFDQVVGSYAFRMRCVPGVLRHLSEIGAILESGMRKHGSTSPDGIAPDEVGFFHREVPMGSSAALLYNLGCTFLPYHDPESIPAPRWVAEWLEAEANGSDMRTYYPRVSGGAA